MHNNTNTLTLDSHQAHYGLLVMLVQTIRGNTVTILLGAKQPRSPTICGIITNTLMERKTNLPNIATS